MSQELVATCPCGQWERVFPVPTTRGEQIAVTQEFAAHAREHQQPLVPTVTVRDGVLAG